MGNYPMMGTFSDLTSAGVQRSSTLANGTEVPPKYEQVLKQVEKNGWDVMDWKDGFSLLHWAARRGRADLCAHFLDLHADPAARDKHGRTALDYARISDHVNVVELLETRESTFDMGPRRLRAMTSASPADVKKALQQSKTREIPRSKSVAIESRSVVPLEYEKLGIP